MALENDYKGLYSLRRGKKRFSFETPKAALNRPPPSVGNLIPEESQPDTSNLTNALSLVGTLKGEPSGKISWGTDSPSGLTPSTQGTDNLQLARILGVAGAAIGEPGSWQSRLGVGAAKLAGEQIKTRTEREELLEQRRYEAPYKEADLAYKIAQTKKLGKEEPRTTAMGEILRKNPDLSTEEIVDIKKALEGEKSGGYYRTFDDAGNISVWKDDKLISGTGKGKTKAKGAGEKPEMTESKARDKLYQIAKYRQSIATSGGLNDVIFAMIARENPEFATTLQGKSTPEAMEEIDRYEKYLRKFTKAESNDPLRLR